jgi:hypothetical protein
VVSSRPPLGLREQLRLLHDDLGKIDVKDRPHVRYFSLMAVHDNPYLSDADLELHLAALRRVLGRLSNNKRPVPVYPVGVSGCLVRVDLRDLDWDSAGEWGTLLEAEPYGVRHDAVHADGAVRKLGREIFHLTASLEAPCVRADWFVVAATRSPLFDHLQQTGRGRRTPPFDLEDSEDSENAPITRVVQLYEADLDARVAAAELGLGMVAELDERWPEGKADLRQALEQGLSRKRWAGAEGGALFAEYVRALKLGVPRAMEPLH